MKSGADAMTRRGRRGRLMGAIGPAATAAHSNLSLQPTRSAAALFLRIEGHARRAGPLSFIARRRGYRR